MGQIINDYENTYSIKLRGNISKYCNSITSDDGTVEELGLDGIGYNKELLSDYGFTSGVKGNVVVSGSILEEDVLGIIIQNKEGQRTIVHPDWILSIEGEKLSNKTTQHTLLESESYVFYTLTNSFMLKSELPICDCGAIASHPVEQGAKLLCTKCYKALTKIHNYSYVPYEYKFIGKQAKADTDNNVWFGLEVEIATDEDKLASFMYSNKDSVYLKADASIRGEGLKAEVVSMPHSFSSLMAKGSWIEAISMLPTPDTDDNGCHVHISRTSFISDKHYSLFYFLIHKMEDIATKVGGRELTDYCKFVPSGKVHTKTKEGRGSGSRTVFLNEKNSATVEARFFKSTTNTINLKAYVQLLESLIKYTKYHAKTVTVKGWFAYISKKSTKYKELLEVLGEVKALEGTVTYRLPKTFTKTLSNLILTDLSRVVSIKTASKLYLNVEIRHYIESKGELTFYHGRTGDIMEDTILLKSILEVIVEKE